MEHKFNAGDVIRNKITGETRTICKVGYSYYICEEDVYCFFIKDEDDFELVEKAKEKEKKYDNDIIDTCKVLIGDLSEFVEKLETYKIPKEQNPINNDQTIDVEEMVIKFNKAYDELTKDFPHGACANTSKSFFYRQGILDCLAELEKKKGENY